MLAPIVIRTSILIVALLWSGIALAQNPTCPTRPAGDSSNACASTAFTGTALTNLLSTPNTWTALQTFNSGIVVVNSGTSGTIGQRITATQTQPNAGDTQQFLWASVHDVDRCVQ